MEMIDRVAKALFEHHYKDDYARYNSAKILFGTENPTWEMITGPDFIPQMADAWRAQARVAIEAMRTPTDKMLYHPSQWFSKTDPFGLIHWQSMIDSALKLPE